MAMISPSRSTSPRPLLPLVTFIPGRKRVRFFSVRLLAAFASALIFLYWLRPTTLDRWGIVRSVITSQSQSQYLHPSLLSAESSSDLTEGSGSLIVADVGSGLRKSREAYVTFLSSTADLWYLTSTRLLNYQLLHDPSTRDTQIGNPYVNVTRDMVVLITPQITHEIEEELRSEGATVYRTEYIEGMPLPEHISSDPDGNHHWKDQYTKLAIFNLTQYDRVLYLDNDLTLLRPLDDVWRDEGALMASPARNGSGLAAIGERPSLEMVEQDERIPVSSGVKEAEKDYFNAGFMLLHPDQKVFENLLATEGYRPYYMEQALLNHFYNWSGSHPWMPLSSKFVSHFPRREDLAGGYHALHAKMWKDDIDAEVIAVWQKALNRMEQHWFHERTGRSLEDS